MTNYTITAEAASYSVIKPARRVLLKYRTAEEQALLEDTFDRWAENTPGRINRVYQF